MSESDKFYIQLDLASNELSDVSLSIADDQSIVEENSVDSSTPDNGDQISPEDCERDVPESLTEEERKRLSEMLLNQEEPPVVSAAAFDNPKQSVIVQFWAPSRNVVRDIDVPLDITANDLIIGLNKAYNLGIDTADDRQCYLSCENPIVLVKGKKLLGELGIRDGSVIIYSR